MASKQEAFDLNDSDSEPDDEQLIITTGDQVDYSAPAQDTKQNNKGGAATSTNFVHLHFQKRNARQCLTAVRGLPEDLDMKKLTRHFKKAWCCNGNTNVHSEWGNIIQLQGDHRRDIAKFLINEGIATREEIKIHGY